MSMDKIQALLNKAGCKPELVESISKSLVEYKSNVREQLEAEYAAKIDEAKKVCIEETEEYKRELARRLQIFCEAKSVAIEGQIAKKSALKESEAESKLINIRNLLEGVDPNGAANNGQLQAALKQAKQNARVALEEKEKALELANQRVAMAEKVLKKNRSLVTENAKLKDRLNGQTLNESRQQRKNGRIDEGRSRTAKPQTTRATILENQDPHPPAPARTPNITNGGAFGVLDIAQNMDEDLI